MKRKCKRKPMQSNGNGMWCDKRNQMEWNDREWNTHGAWERKWEKVRERVFKSFKPDINVLWRRKRGREWDRQWPICVCVWMSVRVCLFLLFHSQCCCCCCSKLRATSKDATYSHWQLTMLPQRVGPGTPCRSQTTNHAPRPPFAPVYSRRPN